MLSFEHAFVRQQFVQNLNDEKVAVKLYRVDSQSIKEQTNDSSRPWALSTCQTSAEDPSHSELVLKDKGINEANLKIEDGILSVEKGKHFEALALFILAKDTACTFKTPTVESWKLYARASVHIALIFLMQKLPNYASNIIEAVMKRHNDVGVLECSSPLEYAVT